MKIGLLGEAPSDVICIQNLLSKRYNEFDYVPMLDRINGSQLDSNKTKRFLRVEYEFKKPNVVVFIRDLDALQTDKTQLKIRKKYFSDFNSVVDKKGVFLLNIYEIEALILADIQTFNYLFGVEIEKVDDPMLVEQPKEFLKERCKKYNESYNVEIFEKINFKSTLNCKYFSDFIEAFDKIVKN